MTSINKAFGKTALAKTQLGLLRLTLLVIVLANAARAELSFDPTWDLPTPELVKSQIEQWAGEQGLSDEQQQSLDQLWSAPEKQSANLLDRSLESFAIAHPQVAKLLEVCRQPFAGPPLPDVEWLSDPLRAAGIGPWVRANATLYYARWCAQHRLYDETIELLEQLNPNDVVDPAALFFYRGVAFQQVVQPDRARSEIVRLLERESEIPRRFQQIARLLERDLAGLDDESLNKIAKQMDDVGRRLSLGRAGKQVQVVEEDVLNALDKLIKQVEDKQKQQQQSSSNSPNQSSKPMEDSRPAELKAPGRVDAKDIGRQAGWGDLPPKEREQALQQIGRDFPAHYREVIEEYFRELATESNRATSSNNPTTPSR